MPEPKNIIHNDGVYERVDNEYFSGWRKMNIPKKEPRIVWNKAKIPFSLWRWMTAWCQVTQGKFASEALVQLFFDKEANRWSAWIPPQKTQGMTVQADPEDPRYAEERKNFPDMMAGTLHHHCETGAFQSATDSSDEKNKEGVHFTIGNLEAKAHTNHTRFATGGECQTADILDFIDFEEIVLPDIIPEDARARIYNDLLNTPLTKEELAAYDFTEELRKVKVGPSAVQGNFGGAYNQGDYYGGYQGYQKKRKIFPNPAKGDQLRYIDYFIKPCLEEDEGEYSTQDLDAIGRACELLVNNFSKRTVPSTWMDTPEERHSYIVEGVAALEEVVYADGFDFDKAPAHRQNQIRGLYYQYYEEVLGLGGLSVDEDLFSLVIDLKATVDSMSGYLELSKVVSNLTK